MKLLTGNVHHFIISDLFWCVHSTGLHLLSLFRGTYECGRVLNKYDDRMGKNASKWILYFTVCYVFFLRLTLHSWVSAVQRRRRIVAHELEFFIQLVSVVGGRSFACCRHLIFKFETETNRLQC